MIASLFDTSMLDENSRLTGNVGLNPISYGEVGAKSIILGGFLFVRSRKLFMKIIVIAVILLGFATLGRAASRGPLLSLFIVTFFYFIAARKNPVVAILTFLFSCVFIIVFQQYIIDLLGFLSPTLKLRVEASLYENDSSDRGELFIGGINQFLDHPLFGNYFVLYPESGKGINTHNMIIDVFMSLGMIGGLLLIVLMIKGIASSYKIIKMRSSINWIACLFVFSVISSMVSTSFYMDPFFSVMLFLTIAATSKLNLN
ncbi:O-antigen ligase family protein [Chryseobacterium chendengshani]|uniref:O-antigen ligase family protein n=1 Tax=Chryseobacterium sp. LJ668 TaxID=2864040 RepID=UPI001C69238E|nr:O-antigen ligase family protein [Chryseobacterium sp. LJ668]MBW8523158.1 O-antigen ligase family protein [Chryseobacterium sp. LJ668]QYK15455.1 O-antigen ligase family protein [Chryseobacterium sp. LJ668]